MPVTSTMIQILILMWMTLINIVHDESIENDDIAINHAANVKNVGFDTSKCDMYDPRNWDKLDAKTIDDLAVKGPKRDLSIENGPNDKLNRHFSSKFYTRILPNGEKCDREWLVYSKDLDKVFCFSCKLFRKWQGRGELVSGGFNNWGPLGERLKQHETSAEHVNSMTSWYELRSRLGNNKAID
ncbi:uncharacterized protein LOC141587944 [Silene latifolia]|uniref:uncharacterized protein LOC141587944 n=1 Tax=Silene latifolia TaxID=37657 RepID=UPI003D77BB34